MGLKILEQDPLTGTTIWFQPSSDGNQVTLIDEQRVGGIVEQNKQLQNMGPHDRRSEVRRVASLPLNVWQDLRRKWTEQGLSYEERQRAMRAFLNDPDHRFFRTDTTRV